MSTQHLSEQEIIRREKLTELNNMGIDAYPAALYPVNTTSVFIKENYKGADFDYAQSDGHPERSRRVLMFFFF